MMSPLPWRIDPEQDDAGTIRDANNEIIAKDYTFLDSDDFEGIPELINRGAETPVINFIMAQDEYEDIKEENLPEQRWNEEPIAKGFGK